MTGERQRQTEARTSRSDGRAEGLEFSLTVKTAKRMSPESPVSDVLALKRGHLPADLPGARRNTDSLSEKSEGLRAGLRPERISGSPGEDATDFGRLVHANLREVRDGLVVRRSLRLFHLDESFDGDDRKPSPVAPDFARFSRKMFAEAGATRRSTSSEKVAAP